MSTNECIEWPFGLGVDGRGIIEFLGEKIYVYRLAMEFHLGSKIESGMEVCHRCDNPKCFNTRHLFMGTHQENFDDAKRKNRMPSGERHAMSKVTDEDVKFIRELRSKGMTQLSIAEKFGISRPLVSMLVNNKHRAERLS